MSALPYRRFSGRSLRCCLRSVGSEESACRRQGRGVFPFLPRRWCQLLCPTVAGESPMQTQPTVSFDGIAVADLVRSAALTHIAHLECMCRDILGCHVVLSQPHRHRRRGRLRRPRGAAPRHRPFAHGRGSGRLSPRNRFVAAILHEARLVCAPLRKCLLMTVSSDRKQAGERLLERLRGCGGLSSGSRRPLVLAIPRGGAEVGAVLARGLDADLEVVLVGKLRARGQPDLELGAVWESGELYLKVIVALPVASAASIPAPESLRDRLECLQSPKDFMAVAGCG